MNVAKIDEISIEFPHNIYCFISEGHHFAHKH